MSLRLKVVDSKHNLLSIDFKTVPLLLGAWCLGGGLTEIKKTSPRVIVQTSISWLPQISNILSLLLFSC